MALSIGFIRFVSSADATQAKGLLTFAPVGLPPTEHVCFCWTHSFAKILASHEINSLHTVLNPPICYDCSPCSASEILAYVGQLTKRGTCEERSDTE